MCFNVSKKSPKKKIAKHDILTFKILREDSSDKKLYSPCQLVGGWSLGKAKVAKIGTVRYGSIYAGLHSCRTITYAKTRLGGSNYAFVAVIPAGAEYYENATEYVSSKLKIIAKLDLK